MARNADNVWGALSRWESSDQEDEDAGREVAAALGIPFEKLADDYRADAGFWSGEYEGRVAAAVGPWPSQYVAEAVDRAQREIVRDVRAGKVPRTVRSWAELAEYVDPNEYGGLPAMAERFPTWDAFLDVANRVVAEVDAWLAAGARRNPAPMVRVPVELYSVMERIAHLDDAPSEVARFMDLLKGSQDVSADVQVPAKEVKAVISALDTHLRRIIDDELMDSDIELVQAVEAELSDALERASSSPSAASAMPRTSVMWRLVGPAVVGDAAQLYAKEGNARRAAAKLAPPIDLQKVEVAWPPDAPTGFVPTVTQVLDKTMLVRGTAPPALPAGANVHGWPLSDADQVRLLPANLRRLPERVVPESADNLTEHGFRLAFGTDGWMVEVGELRGDANRSAATSANLDTLYAFEEKVYLHAEDRPLVFASRIEAVRAGLAYLVKMGVHEADLFSIETLTDADEKLARLFVDDFGLLRRHGAMPSPDHAGSPVGVHASFGSVLGATVRTLRHPSLPDVAVKRVVTALIDRDFEVVGLLLEAQSAQLRKQMDGHTLERAASTEPYEHGLNPPHVLPTGTGSTPAEAWLDLRELRAVEKRYRHGNTATLGKRLPPYKVNLLNPEEAQNGALYAFFERDSYNRVGSEPRGPHLVVEAAPPLVVRVDDDAWYDVSAFSGALGSTSRTNEQLAAILGTMEGRETPWDVWYLGTVPNRARSITFFDVSPAQSRFHRALFDTFRDAVPYLPGGSVWGTEFRGLTRNELEVWSRAEGLLGAKGRKKQDDRMLAVVAEQVDDLEQRAARRVLGSRLGLVDAALLRNAIAGVRSRKNPAVRHNYAQLVMLAVELLLPVVLERLGTGLAAFNALPRIERQRKLIAMLTSKALWLSPPVMLAARQAAASQKAQDTILDLLEQHAGG